MSDLVERLRDPSKGSPRWGDTMAEAADEIERLRAERDAAVKVRAEAIKRMKAAEAERDRLREALWQVLTVMPVFPDAAKQIVGMEDRYNAAITNARDALRESDA